MQITKNKRNKQAVNLKRTSVTNNGLCIIQLDLLKYVSAVPLSTRMEIL